MPRAIRLQDAGYLHHIVTKGNNGQSLFRDDSDYRFYISLIKEARKEYPCQIYNFALLENTTHLLIEPTHDGNLSKFMEMVSKKYARYFNKKYNQSGHVFEGRYKAFVIQPEKFFFSSAQFMRQAPEQFNLTTQLDKYQWSAYGFLAKGVKSPLEVDLHELYLNLGQNDYERQVVFRGLINNYHGETIDFSNRRADVLGDKEFRATVKEKR